MRRYLFAFLFLACLPAAAYPLNPEADQPYKLKVVVHFSKDRLFTDLFKKQIAQELRDGLQAALGEMAQVDMGDSTDPPALMEEIEAQGLQQALDGKSWQHLSDTKTHFVLIDYVNGQYEIQTRQHDGLTGLSSPVVRHAQTFDRQFVARTAELLIDRDFGAVGTVEPQDNVENGAEVQVTLKGSRLGEPVARWVKKDEVLAIAQVNRRGEAEQRSFRVPWALLQVLQDPGDDGVCRCRLFTRYADPLRSGPTILGYRCVKLGTATAPLRLRLVDDKIFAPIPFLRVTVSPHGFDAKVKEEHVTDLDGLVQTDEKTPYENVAFVRVLNENTPRAQVPVPLIDHQIAICPISPNSAESDTLADLDLRKHRLREQLIDNLAVASQLFKDLTDLVAKKLNDEALARAQDGLKTLETEINGRTADLKGLAAAAEKAKAPKWVSPQGADTLIKELQARESKLKDFIASVENAIKERDNPNRAKWLNLIQQAKLLEEEAKFGEAIALYEQVINEIPEGGDKPRLQKHLEELKQEWKVKNDAHRLARQFIYETWPNLSSVKDLKDNLDKARSAVKTCEDVGDRLTLRKVLQADVPHAARLKKEMDAVKSQDTEEAREQIKMIVDVSEGLENLHLDASKFVQASKAAGP